MKCDNQECIHVKSGCVFDMGNLSNCPDFKRDIELAKEKGQLPPEGIISKTNVKEIKMKCYNSKCKDYHTDFFQNCSEPKILDQLIPINACMRFISKELFDNNKQGESMLRTEPRKEVTDTEFFQTQNALETIAIIKDPDGSISIGIARAGRIDIQNRRISSKDGMDIAEGRAIKARTTKTALCEKNYLRGIHALPVLSETEKLQLKSDLITSEEKQGYMHKLNI